MGRNRPSLGNNGPSGDTGGQGSQDVGSFSQPGKWKDDGQTLSSIGMVHQQSMSHHNLNIGLTADQYSIAGRVDDELEEDANGTNRYGS